MKRRRSAGVAALAVFFLAGALIALTSAVSLLWPGGPLEPMWRLNPPARAAFATLAPWAPVLMAAVFAACALAAAGLWLRAPWGRPLAVGILSVNLLGDLANAVFRGDLRALVGVPVAAAVIVYLSSKGVKRYFAGG